ncbi:MAG TPA: GMC family oxidoreductase [Acidimicrobiales bacterium]
MTANDDRAGDTTGEGSWDHDVLVVGSGFGGSVTALRLTEKGWSVGVLEAGRRFTRETLPRTSWQLRRYLWFPRLGLRGIQRISLLKDVMVLSGAGVGGGSLVYANTLYRPPAPFYRDPQWADITDWADELAPYYDQAERMLGVVENPVVTPADEVMRKVAAEMGVEHTFHPTRVGVLFGDDVAAGNGGGRGAGGNGGAQVGGEPVPDPYFGGAGPDRVTCTTCGSCMTGCRVGAKNTLDTSYLYLAERNGAVVYPEHEVVDIVPRAGGGYEVTTVRPGAWLRSRRRERKFRARHVVLSASALGTQKLLHRLRDERRLPNLSPRLGELTRTNSEAIVGAMSRNAKTDHSRGIAITSSFHPDEVTHIEPVRYGKGSNAMGLLAVPMVDGGGRVPRWLRFVANCVRHPYIFLRSLSVRRWSERTIILLVMQTLDNSIRVVRRRGRLTTEPGHGEPSPRWIPAGNEAARRTAVHIDGEAGSSVNEAVLDVPTTAHFIGGCVIGETPETGVIDPYHRVHGHPGLHICDGSAVTANLGVNPSLTITAMTERAMAFWPNKGDPDPRPAPGEPYRRIAPVPPRRPAVPPTAPAALRLPTG